MRTIVLIAFGCLAGVTLGLSSVSRLEKDLTDPETELSPSGPVVDPAHLSSLIERSYVREKWPVRSRNGLRKKARGEPPRNRQGPRKKGRKFRKYPHIRDFADDDILCYPGDLQKFNPHCECCGGWEKIEDEWSCATPVYYDCTQDYQQDRYRQLGRSYSTR